MGFTDLFLIAVGLSMDAFAVAICKGLAMERIDRRRSCLIALFFGGFQALMPLIGWGLGRQFERYITSYDHWIAFLLLAYIGGRMVWDAFHGDGEEGRGGFSIRELLMLAVATSIDALAVGITFAFLKVRIAGAVTIIGCTTFLLSLLGVVIGNRFGSRCRNKATFTGGVILILIGTKILLEHTGVIG